MRLPIDTLSCPDCEFTSVGTSHANPDCGRRTLFIGVGGEIQCSGCGQVRPESQNNQCPDCGSELTHRTTEAGLAYHPEVATPEIGSAVFKYSNEARRREAVRPLEHDSQLTEIAPRHNRDMATRDFIGHRTQATP